jgi:hypothetical protein
MSTWQAVCGRVLAQTMNIHKLYEIEFQLEAYSSAAALWFVAAEGSVQFVFGA